MARYNTATATAPKQAGRKSKHPASAMVKNKMTSPGVKFVDFRADSGERFAVARAKMAEKFTLMSASMKATFAKIRNPIHPIRRKAANQSAREMKAAAAARKEQAVAAAHSVASRKKALVRERRAQKLNLNV